MATAKPAPRPAAPQSPKLGQAAQLLGEGKAEAALLLLRPLAGGSDPLANRLMCSALLALGQPEQALYYAEKALKALPDNPDLLNLTANAQHHAGKLAEAEATLRKAVELEPRHGANLAALARTLAAAGRYSEAAPVAERALAVAPGSAGPLTVLASCLVHLGRADEAAARLQQGSAMDPANPMLLSLLCGTMNYAPAIRPTDLAAAHRAFGRLLVAQMPRRLEFPADRFDAERPIRVGIVSVDLRRHALQHFLEPLLDRFDRSRMRVHLYQHSGVEDEVSAAYRAKEGVRWRNTGHLPPMGLATAIGEDKIDVLIDLIGHVSAPVMMALHLKPAPVIASWLAYPCTTGIEAVDYRIVDSHTDPAGSEGLSVEKLWRLDPVAQAYRPPSDLPGVGPSPSLAAPGGAVTFGSFSAAPKLNDATLRRWALAMKAAPGSRLLVKNHALKVESERAHLARRLELAGVPAGRAELVGPTPGVREHLDLYNRVDIALDTHPYPAITTAMEALVMGVPLVTMTHPTSAGRATVPILKAIGLEDLVTDSHEAFAKAAAALAVDSPRRAALRRDLRDRVLASPLCDEAGWAERFCGALREMWRARCAAK